MTIGVLLAFLGAKLAGIGAGHAGLRTVEAKVDAADEAAVDFAVDMRMGGDHRVRVHR